MALINLLDLEANKVSRNIVDYSFMLTAPTGYGKSPFLAELYGDKALMLSFDNSHKGIPGIHAVSIDSYQTLTFYLSQLENPLVREKFDVVIIDTLFLLDLMIEKSITESYGKELLSDCLQYNKAYKIVDKRFIDTIKRLQRMNYTIVYSCHPDEKKVKMPDGSEIIRFEPQVSERVKRLLMPEIDIRLFAHYNQAGEKTIFTQATPYFDARCRVGNMVDSLPFNVEILKEEFAKGIDKKIKNKDLLVDSLDKRNVVSDEPRDFAVVMEELMRLGNDLAEKQLGTEANLIVNKILGTDDNGNQRTLQNVDVTMTPALETIIIELKSLEEKHK